MIAFADTDAVDAEGAGATTGADTVMVIEGASDALEDEEVTDVPATSDTATTGAGCAVAPNTGCSDAGTIRTCPALLDTSAGNRSSDTSTASSNGTWARPPAGKTSIDEASKASPPCR